MICSSANWRTISTIASCSSVISRYAAVSTAMAPAREVVDVKVATSGRRRGCGALESQGYRRGVGLGVKSPQRRRGLEQHLLPLALRIGLQDDRAAGADRGATVGEDDGADRDREVGGAAEGEPADRARVDAAGGALELVEDLGRPHLRRTRHRARWEAGADGVEARGAGAEAAADLGDELMDGLVGLHRHHLRHLDRAHLANRSEVVAQEVDDHQVLRPVLLVGGEGEGEGGVFGGSCTAARGSLDRAGFGFSISIYTEETLGRGTEDGEVAEAQVGGKRRRVGTAKAAVKVERVGVGLQRESVCKADLVAVAGEEMVEG